MDDRRLIRIEDKLDRAVEELVAVNAEVRKTNGSVAAVLRELGGVHPDGPGEGRTIRDRLHAIENAKASERLVAEALATARTALKKEKSERAADRRQANHLYVAAIATLLAGVTLAGPWLRALIAAVPT